MPIVELITNAFVNVAEVTVGETIDPFLTVMLLNSALPNSIYLPTRRPRNKPGGLDVASVHGYVAASYVFR